MPAILKRYIDSKKLPLGKTVEQTLNTVLESLQNEPENDDFRGYRDELISSCAVALNGLEKIKDPVKLFKNLGLAFEKRGHCIYEDVVVNAFNKVYSVAVNQKKGSKVFKVWKSLENPFTKAHASKYVPSDERDKMVARIQPLIRQRNSAILQGKVFSPSEQLRKLLSDGNKEIREIVAYKLAHRKSTPLDEIITLLSHKDSAVRQGTFNAFTNRGDISINELRRLTAHNDQNVVTAAKSAIRNSFDRNPLTGISGKRKDRKRQMLKRTAVLRR